MKHTLKFVKKFLKHNVIDGHLIIVWLKGSLKEYIQLRSGIANVSSLASPNLCIKRNHQYLLLQRILTSFLPEEYILEGAAPGFVSLGKCNLIWTICKYKLANAT